MELRAHISEAARAARHRNMAPFAAIVLAAAVVSAAFAGLWLTEVVRLPFRHTSGIVGWVSVHGYCKSQEVFNLAVAVVGLPLTMLTAWGAWLVTAALGARVARCAPAKLLKPLALLGAGMFTLTPWLADLRVDTPWPLLLALGGVTLAALVVVLVHRHLGGGAGARGSLQTPVAGEPPKQGPLFAPPCRTQRLLCHALVWFVLPTLLYTLSFEHRLDNRLDYFNQFHEGERLYPMAIMRHGGVPYRDAYLQHGFFRNALIPRIGAALFGPTLEGQRRIEDIIGPLGVVSVYLAGAAFVGAQPLLLGILALFLLSSRVDFPDRVFFAMLSLAAMASAVRRAEVWDLLRPTDRRDAQTSPWRVAVRIGLRGWRLALAGALASLAFWTSVEMGLFALAGMAVFLMAVALLGPGRGLQARVRPLAVFTAGAFFGFWVVGVYFAAHGALAAMIRNVAQQIAFQGETWGLAFPSLRELLPPRREDGGSDWGAFLQADALAMVLPFVTLLLAEAWLVWAWLHGRLRGSTWAWRVLLATCVGVVFARGLLGRSDIFHLYNGLIFQLLIGVLALQAALTFFHGRLARLPDDWRQRRILSLTTLLGALVLLALAAKPILDIYHPVQSLKRRAPLAWADLGVALAASPPEHGSFPGGGNLALPEADVEYGRRVATFIRERTQPGEAIINFSSYATLLFFADRPSATRYFVPCYAATPDLQREALAEIEQRRPRLAYRGIGHGFDGVENKDRQVLMHRYLEENYHPIGRVEDIEFLWRNGVEQP